MGKVGVDSGRVEIKISLKKGEEREENEDARTREGGKAVRRGGKGGMTWRVQRVCAEHWGGGALAVW